MADLKISQLPVASSAIDADVIPIVQSGTTKQVSVLLLKNGMGIYSGAGVPSITTVNGTIFLRTDGDANHTLYVRAANAWVPLSS